MKALEEFFGASLSSAVGCVVGFRGQRDSAVLRRQGFPTGTGTSLSTPFLAARGELVFLRRSLESVVVTILSLG